jgi:hypothetical protein
MGEENAVERRALQRASDADRERVAERIRAAASDGRLGLDELDERLGSALAARTCSELDAVVADLGDVDMPRDRSQETITAEGSGVRRVGRWEVPPQLAIQASTSSVVLDFVEAVFSGPVCRLDLDLSTASLRLIVPDDVAVDVAAVPRHASINVKLRERPEHPRAVIYVEGTINLGSLQVQRPHWRRRRRLRKQARRRR